MQYLSEFRTVTLTQEWLFDELSHGIQYLSQQQVTSCELRINCAQKKYPASNEWQTKIKTLEHLTQGKLVKDDLFVTAPAELKFCHKGNIHLSFNSFDDTVCYFHKRWIDLGILHPHRTYIALGANLGEPLKQLDQAVLALDMHPQVTCHAMSPVYQSIPHGDITQPDYHNAVLVIDTTLPPHELLQLLQEIEFDNGRERKIRWGARTLDLDIILFGDVIIANDNLTIPHPRAYQREFVVKPLHDLDSKLIIPGYGTVADLLLTLPLNNLTEVRHGTTHHH